MEVVWNEDAELDLDNICAFVARVSRPASKKIYKLMEKEANSLITAPYRGPILERTRHSRFPLRSFVSSNRNYRIVYYVDETNNTVYITHILDCRRDPHKFKPERFTLPYYLAENN